MNRFETLLAPPSLKPKELAIHIKMHPEIPDEVSGACRNELVRVGVRLHDELTTVRFAIRLAETPVPPQYSQINRRLTGAQATPIDWKFFAAEFEAFTAEHPEQLGVRELRSVLSELSDPWRIQAWSAQALRIAQNAETEDPAHAPAAWRSAVRLYQAFFARSDVTESHTYRFQTDPVAQEACRDAWNSFLADEVEALSQRVSDYSGRQQAAAVSAALAALAVKDVAAVNPEAARRARAASEDTILSGITSATTLRAAFELYSSAPASDDMDRALLAAMTAETTRLAKGFGGADEVGVIEACGETLGIRATPDDQVGSLMRSARNEFYESATNFARTAINDDASGSVKTLAVRVLELLPPDRSAGNGPNNETITVAEVIGMLSVDELAPELGSLVHDLIQAPSDSRAEERALDRLIEFGGAHPAFVHAPQVREALEMAYSAVFRVAAVGSLAAPGTRGLRMMKKIQKALPPEATIDMSGTAHTAADWIRMLQSRGSAVLPRTEQFNGLRKQLIDAPIASAAEERALSDTISFARAHSLAADEREWLKQNLIIVFKNSAAAYLEDPSANARCLTMMEQIVDYLPHSTRAELGTENATLKEHLDKLRILAIMLSDLGKSGTGHGGLPLGTSQTAWSAPSPEKTSGKKGEKVKAGFACLIAGLIWVAILSGWIMLVRWVWGLVAGNTIMQTTVIVLAVALPVLALWRVAKKS